MVHKKHRSPEDAVLWRGLGQRPRRKKSPEVKVLFLFLIDHLLVFFCQRDFAFRIGCLFVLGWFFCCVIGLIRSFFRRLIGRRFFGHRDFVLSWRSFRRSCRLDGRGRLCGLTGSGRLFSIWRLFGLRWVGAGLRLLFSWSFGSWFWRGWDRFYWFDRTWRWLEGFFYIFVSPGVALIFSFCFGLLLSQKSMIVSVSFALKGAIFKSERG